MFIISISTHLFIHLTTQKKKKKEIIQNIYRYIVKNIKERRFFFYIVREENIRPQVLRDTLSPPFSQHYGTKYISYHILSYYLQLKHWLSSQNEKTIHHRFSFTLHLYDSGSVYKGFERFVVSLILQNI